MQVKISIRFHGAEITYLEINILYAHVKQIIFDVKEFTFDKRSCIKWTIYQTLCNSNGNTFNFIPHVCYFSYLPWIAASESRSLTTLFSTKIKREEIATRTSTSLSHSFRVPSLLCSPP